MPKQDENIIEKLDERIAVLNDLESKTANKVKEVTLNLVKGVSPDDVQVKTVSTRLPFDDYSRLKVLASRLGTTVSNLAKVLLVASLSDSIDAYLSASGVDPSDFFEDVNHAEQELYGDLS